MRAVLFRLDTTHSASASPRAAICTAAALCLSATIASAGPDRPAGAPKSAERTVRAVDLGIRLLPQPLDVAPGITFLGSGPSPEEIVALIPHNRNAADTTNVDQIWVGGALGLNLSGAGLVAGVWDSGTVRDTHQELAGRVTIVDAPSLSTHATHVAGTIGAAGVNAAARGMAGGISIRSRTFANDLSEMNTDGNLINLSNHSYGPIDGWTLELDWGIGQVDTWFADRALYDTESPNFGRYTFNARTLDIRLNSFPHLVSCWSSGNERGEQFLNVRGDNKYVAFFSTPPIGGTSVGSGYYLVDNTGDTSAPPADGNAGTGFDCISGTQVAKNCITVGSINDVTVDPYGAITAAAGSSWGPVDDGRVKPDLVGNGAGVTSCSAAGNASYASLSGTSMSSPNVCGTAALLIEHYKNLNAAALPRSATIKALLIHTAFDGGNAGPDYKFGWGLPDAAKAATFLSDSESETPELNHLFEAAYSGSTQDYVFSYAGPGAIKATLVWTDPQPAATPAGTLDNPQKVLVNDLDLVIIGPPSDTTYWPWTLDPNNPNAPAVRSARNEVDNVEQVVISAPAAGTYTVRVTHTGAGFNQNYSLLVSNVSAGVAPVLAPPANDTTACGAPYVSPAPSLSQGTPVITWSLDAGPPLATIDPGSGVVSWTDPVPSATPYDITITATNAQGTDTATWQLTVAPGDFTGDGLLTDLDVPDFVDHLIDISATRPCAADVNLDMSIDALDVQAFVSGM